MSCYLVSFICDIVCICINVYMNMNKIKINEQINEDIFYVFY